MAFAGLHPVFAVYATFLNRAFDQVLMDCALHKAGVTFVLDRAGATGDDGASHNGMWDLAMLSIVPGLRIAAPRDESTLRLALREAVAVVDAPTVLRFPKGPLAAELPVVRSVGSFDVLHEGSEEATVCIVGIGIGAHIAVATALALQAQGIAATVVDPRWVQPLAEDLIAFAGRHRFVATIEDGVRASGVGSALRDALAEVGSSARVHVSGLPTRFFDHQTRAQLLSSVGLTANDIARELTALVSHAAEQAANEAFDRP